MKNIKLNKLIGIALLPLLLVGCKGNEETIEDSTIYTVTFDAREGSFSDKSKTKDVQVKGNDTIGTFDDIPTLEGYSFDCWSTSVTFKSVFKVESERIKSDITVYAFYNANQYSLTVESDNEANGTVTGAGSFGTGTEVTVTASPKEGYELEGWYMEDKVVSRKNEYTFKMPGENTSIQARFYSEEEYKKDKSGANLVYQPDTNTFTYGMYPQSAVDQIFATTLDSKATLVNGEIYSYDGNLYAKIDATPYAKNMKFDNGLTITSGNRYWFNVEAINWKIMKNWDETYFLASEKVLDVQIYNNSFGGKKMETDYKGNKEEAYCSNYIYSAYRTWLNTTFYNFAFSKGNKNVVETYYFNTADTTDESPNQYAGKDTYDKVSALSYEEMNKKDYGFEFDQDKTSKSTDYARAKGVVVDTSYGSINYYCAHYFTRSPIAKTPNYVSIVRYDGKLSMEPVDKSDIGARPIIYISTAK